LRAAAEADRTPYPVTNCDTFGISRGRNPESVTLLQQGVGNAPGACIFFFAILAKADLLANNPHR
jgi:hypothetical protein